MENRTGTEPIHMYDVEFDWDTTDITEHADRGYSVQLRVKSDTDTEAFYTIAIRLADGTALLRVCDRDLKLLAFRVNDRWAKAFVAAVEDEFLVPSCGIEALQERTGYMNRGTP